MSNLEDLQWWNIQDIFSDKRFALSSEELPEISSGKCHLSVFKCPSNWNLKISQNEWKKIFLWHSDRYKRVIEKDMVTHQTTLFCGPMPFMKRHGNAELRMKVHMGRWWVEMAELKQLMGGDQCRLLKIKGNKNNHFQVL